MKILITGFEPFGAETSNPSGDVLELLPDEIGGARIVKLRLPVSFGRCADVAAAAIGSCRPDCVVCLGQAGGRASVCIERVAINYADAKNPDNDGFRPRRARVEETGPDAYFSNLPVDDLAEAVRACGVPCQVSNSAGTFVCNSLLYRLRHRCGDIPVGFVHLPYAPSQVVGKAATTPSMSLDVMALAIVSIADFLAR